MTEAGWFPDPESPGALRYWDGAQWTEHRRPAPGPAFLAVQPVRRRRSRFVDLLIVLLVVSVGALVFVLVTRDETSTSSSPGSDRARPGDSLPELSPFVEGDTEACGLERKTIVVAMEAWLASGGSSVAAENDPTSGYPVSVELLFSTQDPNVRFLADPISAADWAYDPAVGPGSLAPAPQGRFGGIALVCGEG